MRSRELSGSSLGQNVTRREGPDKLRGTAIYVDDLPRQGVWWGATVRSPIAHGNLRRIRFDPRFDWNQVVVVTAADIPGKNVVPVVHDDQPALADQVVRYVGEPVALVAAPDEATLLAAVGHIHPEIEPLPAVFDVQEALAGRVLLHGQDNLFRRIKIEKGKVYQALRSAPVVIEREYRTGAQDHVYLEPQGMQAEPSGDGIVVRGSMQCPQYLVDGVATLLGIAPERVRVIPCAIGGGFGGKEDVPTLVAGHAALLAWKAKRPVRLVYDRVEDLRYTTKRHPARVRHRTGWTRDGQLVCAEVDLVLDGGAYSTLSPLVLQRSAVHAIGPYQCDHVLITARAVATNHPPRGAFRGFGAPQAIFAWESHIDFCAAQLGVDPVEVRRRNLIRPGGTLATGQHVGEDTRATEVMERALRESQFFVRRAEFERRNEAAVAKDAPFTERFQRHGIGLSVFMHGTGLNGNAEGEFRSRVLLRGNRDGTVSVLATQLELGQGTNTILAQLAAEGLGIPVELVHVESPDTASCPNSGPTVASRTAAIIGGLLFDAGRKLRDAIEQRVGRSLADTESFREALSEAAAKEPLETSVTFRPASTFHWDESRHRGDAYVCYAWSCCVVAVRVDTLTGEVRVLDVTAVQDVGRVVHPLFAAGQVEGGVVQGLGWALFEKTVWRDGVMTNANMTDYVIPTAADVPPIRVVFLDRPASQTPHGAKGLGELPFGGPAPAVSQALRQALGHPFAEVPLAPEVLLRTWEEGDHG